MRGTFFFSPKKRKEKKLSTIIVAVKAGVQRELCNKKMSRHCNVQKCSLFDAAERMKNFCETFFKRYDYHLSITQMKKDVGIAEELKQLLELVQYQESIEKTSQNQSKKWHKTKKNQFRFAAYFTNWEKWCEFEIQLILCREVYPKNEESVNVEYTFLSGDGHVWNELVTILQLYSFQPKNKLTDENIHSIQTLGRRQWTVGAATPTDIQTLHERLEQISFLYEKTDVQQSASEILLDITICCTEKAFLEKHKGMESKVFSPEITSLFHKVLRLLCSTENTICIIRNALMCFYLLAVYLDLSVVWQIVGQDEGLRFWKKFLEELQLSKNRIDHECAQVFAERCSMLLEHIERQKGSKDEHVAHNKW